MEIVLKAILKTLKIDNYTIFSYQGREDLKKNFSNIIKNYFGYKFIFLIDQDENNCKKIKKDIQELIPKKFNKNNYFIRIVCTELESWYWGDMEAIEKSFPRFNKENYLNKHTFKQVDLIKNPSKLLLNSIPEFKKDTFLKKKFTAEKISPNLNINKNTSPSFNHVVNAIKKLSTL